MKKGSGFSFLKNIKISVKTTIPLLILIVLTVITGSSGIANSKNIMVASEEINNVHVANIYNLQQLNYDFEVKDHASYHSGKTESNIFV